MVDVETQTYVVEIERRNTEFEAVKFSIPNDDFGKKVFAMMLLNIATHICPDLEAGFGEGGGGK